MLVRVLKGPRCHLPDGRIAMRGDIVDLPADVVTRLPRHFAPVEAPKAPAPPSPPKVPAPPPKGEK